MPRGTPNPNTPEYIQMERRCLHLENTVAKRNKELNEEIKLLKQANRQFKLWLAEKDKIIETLKLQVEELQRMVFGKKKDNTLPKNNDDFNSTHGQSADKQSRSPDSYRRPTPKQSEITETNLYPIHQCPKCSSCLKKIRTIVRYQEDIVLPILEKIKSKKVEKQKIQTGWCPQCQKRYQTRPVSPQLNNLGPNTKTMILYSNYVLRLSFQQIKDLLQDLYQLTISDGEISNILAKKAIKLQPVYEKLKTQIRGSPAIHLDETSWPQQKQNKYAWVMTSINGEEAVFSVGQSRGKGNAENLLGDFNGTRITDGYAVYKNLKGDHQICWVHCLRKAKDLAQSDVLAKDKQEFCQKFYTQLVKLYEEVKENTAKRLNRQQRMIEYLRLRDKIGLLAKVNSQQDLPQKLVGLKLQLSKYSQSLLTCIIKPNVPLDNNKAERKLRHLVLKRKNCFGTKTDKGSHVFEINASVLLSYWWSNRDNWFSKIHSLANT